MWKLYRFVWNLYEVVYKITKRVYEYVFIVKYCYNLVKSIFQISRFHHNKSWWHQLSLRVVHKVGPDTVKSFVPKMKIHMDEKEEWRSTEDMSSCWWLHKNHTRWHVKDAVINSTIFVNTSTDVITVITRSGCSQQGLMVFC